MKSRWRSPADTSPGWQACFLFQARVRVSGLALHICLFCSVLLLAVVRRIFSASFADGFMLQVSGAAPLLAGAVPLFLGGFAPEAVEAAQARLCQVKFIHVEV